MRGRRVSARCPGSCGELIQGYIQEKKLLLSYPVDLYSQVTISEGNRNYFKSYYPKVQTALEKTLQYLELPLGYLENLDFHVESQLPVGKGMASSTADIGAAVAAVGAFFGQELTNEEIARIALVVEPTDSIIFSALTLFDYVEGTYQETLGTCPSLEIIVLEGRGVVDTLDFHKNDYDTLIYARREELAQAYQLVKQGIVKEKHELLGKAALLSAKANQDILPKEYLEEVSEVALKQGALGVNVAHSGTVVGVLVDSSQQDGEKLLGMFKQNKWSQYFEKVYLTHTVAGGPSLL